MSRNAEPIAAALAAARAVRKRAHAPYSGFKVGAAILDAKGAIYVGTNVENASYPEGICAEGAAIAAMVAAGGRAIQAVVVVADPAPTPCGGCRQKLAEFGGPDARVIMAGPRGKVLREMALGQLLPLAFKL